MGRKSSSTAEDPLIETVLHDCEGGEGEAGERGGDERLSIVLTALCRSEKTA